MNALDVFLAFEEMQELKFFLEEPEKMITFASLQRDFEQHELLEKLNQDDTFKHEFDTSNRSVTNAGR